MRAGDRVGDRFVIERRVGAGGMGLVYLARDTTNDVNVALKVLRPALENVPPSVRALDEGRFVREAELLAELSHPAIVRYVAHGDTAEDGAFLAMEWLEGETLSAHLRRVDQLSVEACVTLASRLASGLACAHAAGIIHRDVKPSNVILLDGRIEEAKLVDFGVARLGGANDLTRTGGMIGTPGYAAPEQARGTKEVDARADIFALGALLYACASGSAPFEGDDLLAILAKTLFEEPTPLRALRSDLPSWLESLVDRMLAKDPDERPRDANEVLTLLESAGSSAGARSLGPRRGAPRESHVVSLVLVAAPPLADTTSDAPTSVDARTLDDIFGEGGASSGRIEPLRDGTIAATWPSVGEAIDRASRAARFALAARARMPNRHIAVVTGRSAPDGAVLIGEAIDRAAALLRSSRAPAILVDDVSAGLLHTAFVVQSDAGEVRLVSERERTAPRKLLGKPSPFVGRRRETATLTALLEECEEEHLARVALVTGSPGIGKSRLCDEMIAAAAKRDARSIWLARGDALRAGSPFGMLGALVDASEGVSGPASRRSFLPESRIEASTILRQLLRRLDHADAEDHAHDPAKLAQSITRAWCDFLRAPLDQGPVLLVLEDLQWGDLPTVRAIDAALKDHADAPLFVLALGRSGVTRTFPDLWAGRGLVEIELTELPRKAAEVFIRHFAADFSDEIVARLVAHAAGNPLHLEELVRAELTGHGSRLPGSILAIFQARLEELDPEARRVLCAASVLGLNFWSSAAAAVAGSAGTIDAVLDDLTTRELVAPCDGARFEDETELTFRHAFTREAAYAMLEGEARRVAHGRAAAWLERAGEMDPMVLGNHHELAANGPRAAEWYLRGAEQALSANDVAVARERATRAHACDPTPETKAALQALLASTSFMRGELPSAVELGTSAMSSVRPGSAVWCRAAASAVIAAAVIRDDESFLRISKQLAHTAPAADARDAYVIACGRAARHLFYFGKHALAEELLARLVAEGDPERTGKLVAPHEQAAAALVRGDFVRYLALHVEARGRATETGDRYLTLNSAASIGHAYFELGRAKDAIPLLQETINEAEKQGYSLIRAFGEILIGSSLASLGMFEEAIAMCTAGIERHSMVGDARLGGVGLQMRSRAALSLGRVEDAEASARKAVETLSRWPGFVAPAHAALAETLVARGEVSRALESSRAGYAIVKELGVIGHGDAFVRIAHAEILDRANLRDEARDVLASSRDRARSRAAALTDESERAMFLLLAPDIARTLKLAQKWGL